MNYRSFIAVVGGCCVVLGLACDAGRAAERKPNIIYIMADELGYFELSCLGNPHIQTPHLDRMAAQGLRFTQALAGSSLCAPTRACLMTGKHSGHTSIRSNGGGTPLRPEEETIASVLKRAGYATGGFGKWGCGGRGSTGVPEQHGFDLFVGYYDQVHAHTYYPAYLVRNSEELPLPGNMGGRTGQTYSHYVIVEEARKFIRASQDQPFFCYLPVTPPHGMFDIPDEDPAWAIYRDKTWAEGAKRYAAMVSMLDRQIGELLALLKELGLDENTIVFFSGDNGGADYFVSKDFPRGFHAANVNPNTGLAFRGRKGDLYEGGLRIPMLVRWPGRIQPGRVSDHLCYFPDILPTVAELAGAEAPKDIDGISLVPELLGQDTVGRAQQQHEFLYWELGAQTAVRMGHWKAIQPNRTGSWELYDLSQDIGEENDLAAAHPDRLAQMQEFALRAHQPVREGEFHNREIHEKDRQAKWGEAGPPSGSSIRMESIPNQGLLPRTDWKIVSASSENRSNNKLAQNAIDGDPGSLWHTQFSGTLQRHPHELILDLGAQHAVTGFCYLARQDPGWNGTVKDCEFYVSNTPDQFGLPVASVTLAKTKKAQAIQCQPVQGRYVRWRILSEINGGPWASAAELAVVGQ